MKSSSLPRWDVGFLNNNDKIEYEIKKKYQERKSIVKNRI